MRVGKLNVFSSHDNVATPDNANFYMVYIYSPDGKAYKKSSAGIVSLLASNEQWSEVEITIQPASIKQLNSSPIELIAAPGAGLCIELLYATCKLVFGTTAYGATAGVNLISSAATTAQISFAILNSTLSKKFSGAIGNPGGAAATQVIENDALVVKTTVDPTLGDSPITIKAIYRIVAY